MEEKKNEEEIIVNGQAICKEEFDKISQDSSCRLKKLNENEYKKLDKLEG